MDIRLALLPTFLYNDRALGRSTGWISDLFLEVYWRYRIFCSRMEISSLEPQRNRNKYIDSH